MGLHFSLCLMLIFEKRHKLRSKPLLWPQMNILSSEDCKGRETHGKWQIRGALNISHIYQFYSPTKRLIFASFQPFSWIFRAGVMKSLSKRHRPVQMLFLCHHTIFLKPRPQIFPGPIFKFIFWPTAIRAARHRRRGEGIWGVGQNKAGEFLRSETEQKGVSPTVFLPFTYLQRAHISFFWKTLKHIPTIIQPFLKISLPFFKNLLPARPQPLAESIYWNISLSYNINPLYPFLPHATPPALAHATPTTEILLRL